jgi:hypothetical protein
MDLLCGVLGGVAGVPSHRITVPNLSDCCSPCGGILGYKQIVRKLIHKYPDIVQFYIEAYYDMYGDDETARCDSDAMLAD